MTLKRWLYVIAAVILFLAWLLSLGAIDASGDALTWQAMIALGLTVGFAGHAA